MQFLHTLNNRPAKGKDGHSGSGVSDHTSPPLMQAGRPAVEVGVEDTPCMNTDNDEEDVVMNSSPTNI
jgi:hypothetical protein